MKVFIEDSCSDDPKRGRVRNAKDPSLEIARTFRGNPLRESISFESSGASGRLICWSGNLGQTLFESNPATWLSPGHNALNQLCDQWLEVLQHAECLMCFRPHARHVLNDVQSTLSFLKQREGQSFGLALDPAGLLEPSMLDDVEDHLTRMFEILGPRCDFLVLHDIQRDEAADELRLVPFGEGLLPAPLLVRLIGETLDPATPVVLKPERVDEQLARLEHVEQAGLSI